MLSPGHLPLQAAYYSMIFASAETINRSCGWRFPLQNSAPVSLLIAGDGRAQVAAVRVDE